MQSRWRLAPEAVESMSSRDQRFQTITVVMYSYDRSYRFSGLFVFKILCAGGVHGRAELVLQQIEIVELK